VLLENLSHLVKSITLRGTLVSDLLILFWFALFIYTSGLKSFVFEEANSNFKVWLGALFLGAFLFFPAAALLEQLPMGLGLRALAILVLVGVLWEGVKFAAAYLSLGFAPEGRSLTDRQYALVGMMAGVGFAGMEGWVVLSRVLTIGSLGYCCIGMALVQRFFLLSFHAAAPAIVLIWWGRKKAWGGLALLGTALFSGILMYFLPLLMQSDAYFERIPLLVAALTGISAFVYLRGLVMEEDQDREGER
jgi:hypothetical protein